MKTPPTAQTASLEAFRTDSGYLVRFAGRGTMRESRAFHSYVLRCLEAASDEDTSSEGADLMLDLSDCQRLDSTFLGCLVDLHKRFNRGGRTRFFVAAPPPVCKSLLGVSRLDRLLPVRDEAPQPRGDGASLLTDESLEPRELGFHVMECHRRLAEQGGPASDAFARIADQLEKELSAAR